MTPLEKYVAQRFQEFLCALPRFGEYKIRWFEYAKKARFVLDHNCGWQFSFDLQPEDLANLNFDKIVCSFIKDLDNRELKLRHRPPQQGMEEMKPCPDPINHPAHYTSHPSGIECIDVVEHMLCNMANAIKYIWRADLKCDAIEDLEKAVWYLNREINRRKKAQS